MPSEYSVDVNRGFQGVSMANLEKGIILVQILNNIWKKTWENWASYLRS